MDELLKQILSNELLTEETKSQLQEGIKKIVAEAVKTAEAKATVEVQHRLAEEYVEWQDKLLEAIDTKVNDTSIPRKSAELTVAQRNKLGKGRKDFKSGARRIATPTPSNPPKENTGKPRASVDGQGKLYYEMFFQGKWRRVKKSSDGNWYPEAGYVR